MQPWPAVQRRTLATLVGGLLVSLLLVIAPPALAAPPANDLFAAAEVLTGESATATATLTDATKEAGEPNHYGYTGGTSVWYRWTATADRTVTVQLASSSAHPALAV